MAVVLAIRDPTNPPSFDFRFWWNSKYTCADFRTRPEANLDTFRHIVALDWHFQ